MLNTVIPALCLFLAAPAALAQSPDLRIEPELLASPAPPARAGQTVAEMTAERDRLLPLLQKTLARIDAKIAALKAAGLTYRYFIPMDRTKASQELLSIAATLESDEAWDLRQCLLRQRVLAFDDYQSDHTACRGDASAAWNSAEVRKNPRLPILLEAMVFRTRNELSQLQAYESQLAIARLAYATEIRQFGDRTANLEFELIAQNPAFQCNPSLGTVRLDEPSVIDGQAIPPSMKDVKVQNQGPLGTCYANAASVALEAITARPNSALDLAIRYSMQGTRGDREISADFGGSFCGAVQIANRDGLCERRDSWIEETSAQAGKNTAAASLALNALKEFIGRRSSLPRSDWQLLETVAPALIPRILEISRDQELKPLQTVLARNLTSLVTSWVHLRRVTKPAGQAAVQALRNYDYAQSDTFLPEDGKYFANRERAAQELIQRHQAPVLDLLAAQLPQLPRSYIESQAGPFIRSALQQMTGNRPVDELRSAVALHRTIQETLGQHAQSSANRDQIEQLLVEVLMLTELSRKAQPESPLDPIALAQSLFSTRNRNINSALLDVVAPKCQVPAQRMPIPPVSCQEHRARDARFLETKLLQSLRHGHPLGISYCAEVLGQVTGPVAQRGRCGGHESLLTGIRYNPQTQRCDVLIWNSWGNATGKTWIDTARLLPFAMGIQELSAVGR